MMMLVHNLSYFHEDEVKGAALAFVAVQDGCFTVLLSVPLRLA